MIEFVAGLLIGLAIMLPVCFITYRYGRYRGQVEAHWEGYDFGAGKVNND